jgi:MFS family permease
MPDDQRGLAQGVTHSASRIGNAVAPIAIAGIIASLGWRASFLITGALSLLWVTAWYWYFRDEPKTHPKMTPGELAELPTYLQVKDRSPVPWGPMLRRILPITFVDFCYGWTLWVYLTWIPSFFKDNYGLNLKKFALFTSLVLFAGVIGDSAGGIISDRWYRKTGNLKAARRGVLVTGLLGSFFFTMPTIFIHNLTVAAVCLALSFFFLELTNPILWSMPMDIAPAHAGTASGLMNTGFGIAGILSPFIFGLLVDRTGSWEVPFVLSSALLFIGAGASMFIDPTRRIGVEPALSQVNST